MSQENQTQGKPQSPDPDERYFRGREGRYFGKRLLDGTSYWEEKTSPRLEMEYQELPHPTGPYPYRLDLATVLAKDDMDRIKKQGKLVFHLTGDVGGIKCPEYQHAVAAAMEQDYDEKEITPKFLYIVGDIVYNFGESKEYYSQFYEPYTTYPGPIFAIPGNHDGMIAPGSSEPSLKAFMDNFCASRPHLTKESVDTGRDTMTQPHCYWTLTTPYAILVGLYTNVVEGGELDNYQIAWLHNELVEAKKPDNEGKALILAMHQPVYSYGRLHGGSERMYQILEDATKETGKRPDMVVAGHDHNYQRFTRTLPNNQQIPYLVVGGGGHWLLDPVNEPTSPDPDVEPVEHVDNKHGYLRLTVSTEDGKAKEIRGDYITVPSSQMSWRRGARVESGQADSFVLNLATHQVEPPPN